MPLDVLWFVRLSCHCDMGVHHSEPTETYNLAKEMGHPVVDNFDTGVLCPR